MDFDIEAWTPMYVYPYIEVPKLRYWSTLFWFRYRARWWTQARLAGVARLIGPDGTWSVVVVELYRRVCTVSIHISTSMQKYVLCTYKYMKSWTCMYMLYTIYIYLCSSTYMYIHFHDFMKRSEHVHICLYHVQTRMYRFAESCPGGQDSRCFMIFLWCLNMRSGTFHDSTSYGGVKKWKNSVKKLEKNSPAGNSVYLLIYRYVLRLSISGYILSICKSKDT